MARLQLCGKKRQFGNNVPWSKKKTRRTWQPNVQRYTFYDPELGRTLRLKASAKTMRSIEKMGLRAYLRKNG